ncbi:MAG: 50S ribosomal protein L23 [Clostridium sp.]|nr:50S ribosomal protein L23 [Clostridium sp.]
MRVAEDIIIRPYITEKSNDGIADGKYTFMVNVKATKTEIRHAVEKLFQVKVLSVNTINIKGKKKRMGVHEGYRPDWKKAIVKIDTDPSPVEYLTEGGKMTTISKKYKTSIEEFDVAQ